jgi:hypothetical protein
VAGRVGFFLPCYVVVDMSLENFKVHQIILRWRTILIPLVFTSHRRRRSWLHGTWVHLGTKGASRQGKFIYIGGHLKVLRHKRQQARSVKSFSRSARSSTIVPSSGLGTME